MIDLEKQSLELAGEGRVDKRKLTNYGRRFVTVSGTLQFGNATSRVFTLIAYEPVQQQQLKAEAWR